MAMPTVNTQVKRIAGLLSTEDLNDWEQDFVESIQEYTHGGMDVQVLSEKQRDVVARIFRKHFAA